MKKTILFGIGCLLCSVVVGQSGTLSLPTPNRDRGLSIMKALENRKSVSEYADLMLSREDFSDLLWAANGINRPGEGKKTAGSAMNRQDVMIYTFTTLGVHLYDAQGHALKPVAEGDHRLLFGERGMAPLIILLVTDVEKFGEVGTPELRREWGAIDLGLVSQNIALFCAGNGLATKQRAGMNREGIKELLGLKELQLPMLNHAVGYPKIKPIPVEEPNL